MHDADRLPVVRFRCDQRWDDLAPLDGDDACRLCARCQKPVHDFRGRSAAHVRAVHRRELAVGRERPCGAYDRAFLDTPLPPEPGPGRRRWTRVLAALVAPVSLGAAAGGCTAPRTAERASPTMAPSAAVLPGGVECRPSVVRVAASSDTTAIRGVVRDGHTGEALRSASVRVVAPSEPLAPRGAVTDAHGAFVLARRPGDPDSLRVVVEFVGYTPVQSTLAWGQRVEVEMHDAPLSGDVITLGDVAVEPPPRRPWWRRIFGG